MSGCACWRTKILPIGFAARAGSALKGASRITILKYYSYRDLGGTAEVRAALTGEVLGKIDAKVHTLVGCLRRELSSKLSVPASLWTFLNQKRAVLNDEVRMGEINDIEFKDAAVPTSDVGRRLVTVSFRQYGG